MSMWLELVKVEMPLLSRVRGNPGLIGGLFRITDDTRPSLSGFRPAADAFGYDYRTISAIAEGRAEIEEGKAVLGGVN